MLVSKFYKAHEKEAGGLWLTPYVIPALKPGWGGSLESGPRPAWPTW